MPVTVYALLSSIVPRPDWLSAHAADLLSVLASLALAVVLWRQRHWRGLRRVFLLLAAFAVVGAAAQAGSLTGGFPAWAKVAVAVLNCGVVLALVWCLPRAAAAQRHLRRDDVERLRLLAAAVTASGDGVMIAEPGGEGESGLRIVYANPAFESMTGYSSDEAVGLSPSILADDDEPDAFEEIRQILRGTRSARLEVSGRRKDGSRVWTEWQVVPVADDAGRYTHRVAVLRDTTERRRSEQAVRESEARFRGLFEHAADAIFLLESGGRIVDANRQACESVGYTRGELTALKITDLDAGARSVEIEPGQTLTADNWYRRKDGTHFPVEVRLAVLDADGRRLKLAMVRDVTRRQRAEQALRQREELLQNIMSHIPCGVFWKDRRSVYLGCNDQVARDLGMAGPEELVGRTDYDLGVPPAEAALFREGDQRVMQTGEPVLNQEQPHTPARGRHITILTSKVPLRDAGGAIVGVLGVYQDITERKRLEEQFRQAQKLEAVGRLAGGIAHDFNNLLTVILGNAELLRQLPPKPPEAVGLVDDIHGAADRAAGLVRQLLMFSRRQPSRPEVIDLNEVLTGLAGLLRRLLGERVEVRAQLSPEAVLVRADRGQLEQVVMNLAVNARDAMPDGGTLTLTTANPEAGRNGKGPAFARLSVADTGTGMSEELKARIFEPFFTTKGPDKGTGLGLATVYGIVQQAGGHINVDSTLGAGTTFHIYLPECTGTATPSTERPAREAAARENTGRGRSVLLVEDEDGVRKMARFVLEGQGYRVAEARDAETALELLKPDPAVDLLVTDLSMPGMDGRELAGRLRAVRPGVGVVFVSGYVPEAGRLDDVPAAVFLPKPFTPTELLRGAGKALRHSP
jgi:two-component system cell cycle sensor histidine kinase/response regulator CckA